MSTSRSLVGALSLALLLVAAPGAPAQSPPDSEPGAPDPNAPLMSQPSKGVPTLVELQLPLTKLADWGRREFEYRKEPEGPSLGSVVMETKVEKDTVTLNDRIDLQLKGKPYQVEITATGPLGNLLRPTHLAAKGTTDDLDGSMFEFTAEFTATSASVTSKGKARDKEVPAGTVTDWALYRILTLLPRTAGFATTYDHSIDAGEMHLKAGGSIICVGQESVGAEGHAIKAWRFDVSSGKRTYLSAWVDDDGRLVRLCLDGSKWIVAKG